MAAPHQFSHPFQLIYKSPSVHRISNLHISCSFDISVQTRGLYPSVPILCYSKMGDRENCRRSSRLASKKRSAQEAMPELLRQLNKKNRVVLGDIQNVISLEDGETKFVAANEKAKCKPKRSDKKGITGAKETYPLEEKLNSGTGLDASNNPETYVSDIYEYLHKMEIEIKRRPRSDYLKKAQTDVTANMRGILMDWLVEVGEEFKLQSDTVHLTVSYIDRFLSKNAVNRQRLQLLGVSSMLIASKYEEITPPNVEDFCYITDNTYTKQDVVKMESDVLNSLGFEMGNPTVKTFMRRLTSIAQEDYQSSSLQLEFLGCYLAELSLLDYQCVKFLPSLVAASAIFLARYTLQPHRHPWNSVLQRHSGYTSADLKECVGILHDLQLSRRGGALVAIREKYKHHKFEYVSALSSPPEIPEPYFEGANVDIY